MRVSPDLIGWLASAVLIATLIRQIVKQQGEEPAQGVSRWLFIGQCTASAGFVAYSFLVGNWVFIVTNSAVLVTAVVGQVLLARRNTKPRGRRATPGRGPATADEAARPARPQRDDQEDRKGRVDPFTSAE